MKEQNRLRIERLTARYEARRRATIAADEAEFLARFDDLCARVLRPLMEEFAEELRKAGHDPRVALGGPPGSPHIELALGLRDGKGRRNVVGFSVIRWSGYPLQILAYLEVNDPPFDLQRFACAADVTADCVEQILADAIEHVIVCDAP
ncbi:MAG: hypothetical protein IT372_23375 [Polyangiaceae bacterium]|nr:hypothetical protein [Polyangiaceae bacterium]